MHQLFYTIINKILTRSVLGWIAISSLLFVVSYPLWRAYNWYELEQWDWGVLSGQYLVESISAISFLLLLGIGFSTLLGLRIVFFLLEYPTRIKAKFSNVLLYFGYLPSLLWVFFLSPVLFVENSNIVYKVLIGALLATTSIFPIVLHLLFTNINKVPQVMIDVGYSLGASKSQIAFSIIIPRIRKNIFIALITVSSKILLELIILAIALSIISLNIGMYLSIVVVLFLVAVIVIITPNL